MDSEYQSSSVENIHIIENPSNDLESLHSHKSSTLQTKGRKLPKLPEDVNLRFMKSILHDYGSEDEIDENEKMEKKRGIPKIPADVNYEYMKNLLEDFESDSEN